MCFVFPTHCKHRLTSSIIFLGPDTHLAGSPNKQPYASIPLLVRLQLCEDQSGVAAPPLAVVVDGQLDSPLVINSIRRPWSRAYTLLLLQPARDVSTSGFACSACSASLVRFAVCVVRQRETRCVVYLPPRLTLQPVIILLQQHHQ